MRKILTTAMVAALISATTYADLQNVEVGGGIRIRGNMYSNGLVEDLHSSSYTEQRTRLNWTADFTDEVSLFVELDSYDIWGNASRRVPGFSGVDFEGSDVQLYQAYITLGQAWGTNFDIQIGRQELVLGSEWLLGNNDTASSYTGLSHDGIVATYNADTFSVTGFGLKLFEGDIGVVDNDEDADLYGLYASYTGREDMTIDAYWIFLDQGLDSAAGEDGLEMHTLGVRAAGTISQFDYEAEVAYQLGDAATDIDFDAFGANLEVGYTFDTNYQPRVFAGAAIFEGSSDDGEDLGFNRIYSDWEYSEFLSNADLSNAIVLRLGASMQATEKIGLAIVGSHFEIEEEDAPLGFGADYGFVGNDESTLGQEVGLYMTYAYSEDVQFEAGYAHFFSEEDYFDQFGSADDADYLFGEISISF